MPDINMQHFGELQRNQHSIDIEIDALQIASPQQNFPMMLETPNSSNSMLNVVAMNEFGKQLPTEIEGIANNKNWIYLKDLVQPVINRKMKVFYSGSGGKLTADNMYGSEAVWDDNYVMVYHFNQDPNTAGVGGILDSTGSNNATPSDFAANKLIDGDYGKGIKFEGAQVIISVSNVGITGTSARTVEIFAKTTSATIFQAWGVFGVYSNANVYGMYHTTDGTTKVFIHTGDWDTGYDMVADENLYWMQDHSGTTGHSYANGVQTSISPVSKLINTGAGTLKIGRTIGASLYFEGEQYEFRISDIVRSANYATTTHNNLNNPTASGTDSFYKSISEEHNFVESLQSLGRVG